MPVWLTPVLGAVKWLGDFLVKLGSLLVPYWLGKSRERNRATGEAVERLGDAHENVVRIRTDSDARERLRDKYRR